MIRLRTWVLRRISRTSGADIVWANTGKGLLYVRGHRFYPLGTTKLFCLTFQRIAINPQQEMLRSHSVLCWSGCFGLSNPD